MVPFIKETSRGLSRAYRRLRERQVLRYGHQPSRRCLKNTSTPHPITMLLEHYAPSNPEAHVAYRAKSGHAECVSDQEDRFLSFDIEVSIMPSPAYRSLAPSSLERTGL
jgi:hypothetical protein